jgi:hypothetical protein
LRVGWVSASAVEGRAAVLLAQRARRPFRIRLVFVQAAWVIVKPRRRAVGMLKSSGDSAYRRQREAEDKAEAEAEVRRIH